MAFGTLANMMINVGANLSPLGKGLAAAKGQLSSLSQMGSQVASGMTSSFGRTAGSIALISGAIYGLQQAFTAAINAADEYRLATINIAATMTDWLDQPTKSQQDFNDHLVYAQEMYKVLELEAVKHFASGKDLQLAWTIMTQKGVQLRFDEVNALGMVVDKIKLATQGQMSTIQIAQEIRSLLNGQARTTDQIALLLKDKYGKEWKNIVNEQRKSGNLLQWLSEEWQGLAAAQQSILNTLESQSTTLWTMIRRVGREGLSGAYLYIVNVLKEINNYLIEHEAIISQNIAAAWGSLEPTITAIGLAIRDAFSYISGGGNYFAEGAGYILFFTEAVIAAVKALTGFIEANAWILKIVAALWLLSTVIGVVTGTIIPLIASIWTAGSAIGAFVLAGSGLGAVAIGFSGIGIAVLALVPLVLMAVEVMTQFGIAAAEAVNTARSAASFATGITPEEYQRRMKSPTYRREATPFEKVYKEGVQEVVPMSGLLGKELYRAKEGPVKLGTDDFKRALSTGQPFLAIDENQQVRILNSKSLSPEASMELGKLALEGKKYQARVEDAGKGGKGGGKAPEKLSEWPAIKAERDKELEIEKNRLNVIEKNAEIEKAINDNKYAQGILSGTQYAQALIDLDEKVYQGKVAVINKERAIDKEAYEFRKANIEQEVSRGALSPEKALLEQRKALAEYQKQNIKLDKDFFDAGIDKTKALVDATKNLIAARRDLINLGMDLMKKFAWGPLQEQRVALLENAREFAAFEKKIGDMKFVGENGKIQIDPEFISSTREFAEAAKQLNLPWAEPLRLIVEEMKNTRDPARMVALQGQMQALVPQMKATGEFQIKNKAEIDSYVSTITNGITSIVDAIMEGGADLNKAANNLFKGIFKDSLKKGMDFLQQTLTDLFTKMFQSLGPGLASAVMGVIGIVGMMLTSKSSKSFAASGVESGITAHEAVRGIIGGETSIPIAQISVSLSEAMAPHLSVLRQIEANTRGGGANNQPVNVTYRNDSGNRASSKEAMDAYFREYLLQGAGG